MKKSLLVKAWREHKHLTQRELSDATGITHNTINNWENGHTEPRHQKIRQLSEGLNITPEQFMDGPDKEKVPGAKNTDTSLPKALEIPEDISEGLRLVAKETGIGTDILIRSCLGLFVSLERSKQLSMLRAYLDVQGNRIEEMMSSLDERFDPDKKDTPKNAD